MAKEIVKQVFGVPSKGALELIESSDKVERRTLSVNKRPSVERFSGL